MEEVDGGWCVLRESMAKCSGVNAWPVLVMVMAALCALRAVARGVRPAGIVTQRVGEVRVSGSGARRAYVIFHVLVHLAQRLVADRIVMVGVIAGGVGGSAGARDAGKFLHMEVRQTQGIVACGAVLSVGQGRNGVGARRVDVGVRVVAGVATFARSACRAD